MSIALDLALFLRENQLIDTNQKPIEVSAALRGLLFTIMFRLGSNPYAWISQEELAKEMSMTLNGLHKLLNKAKGTGLIESEQNRKDKRKSVYRAAEFLINYHLERRKKDNRKPEKYTDKSMCNLEKYTDKSMCNTQTKVCVISEEKTPEGAKQKGCKAEGKLLKVNESKIKANKQRGGKSEKTEKSGKSLSVSDFFDMSFDLDGFIKNSKILQRCARADIDPSFVLEKFLIHRQKKGAKKFSESELEIWCLNEIDHKLNRGSRK